MITALAIMLAIAGYLQFAGNNVEEEDYLAVDNTISDIPYQELESLDSEVDIVLEDYLEWAIELMLQGKDDEDGK